MVPLAASVAPALTAASMGGAGIGAGASAGLGAALGATLFNPLTIGLGVAMMGLSIYQGLQQRRALKKQYAAASDSAQFQFDALNENIRQLRRAYADESEVASQQARASLAAAINSIDGVSGESLNLYRAQRAADAAIDQTARRTARDDQVRNIQHEKEAVAAHARAGMATAAGQTMPVGFQAISGLLGGAQLGMGLNATVQQYQSAARLQDAYRAVLPAANAGDPVALAKVQALNSGINPALVNERAVVAPFLTMNEISSLQLQTARDSAAFSRTRLQLLHEQKQGYDALIRAMRGY